MSVFAANQEAGNRRLFLATARNACNCSTFQPRRGRVWPAAFGTLGVVGDVVDDKATAPCVG